MNDKITHILFFFILACFTGLVDSGLNTEEHVPNITQELCPSSHGRFEYFQTSYIAEISPTCNVGNVLPKVMHRKVLNSFNGILKSRVHCLDNYIVHQTIQILYFRINSIIDQQNLSKLQRFNI